MVTSEAVLAFAPSHCYYAFYLFLLFSKGGNLCDWLLEKKIPLDQELKSLRVLDQKCTPTCGLHAWHGLAQLEAKVPLEITYTARLYLRQQAINRLTHGGIQIDLSPLFSKGYGLTKEFGAIPEGVWAPKVALNEIDHAHQAQLLKRLTKISSNPSLSEQEAIKKIDQYLDSIFGELPKDFAFEGKTYTPKTFVTEWLKITDTNHGIQEIRIAQVPYDDSSVVDSGSRWSSKEPAEKAETQAKRWLDEKKPVIFNYGVIPDLADGNSAIKSAQYLSPLEVPENVGHAVFDSRISSGFG